jgi:hypothetical protein
VSTCLHGATREECAARFADLERERDEALCRESDLRLILQPMERHERGEVHAVADCAICRVTTRDRITCSEMLNDLRADLARVTAERDAERARSIAAEHTARALLADRATSEADVRETRKALWTALSEVERREEVVRAARVIIDDGLMGYERGTYLWGKWGCAEAERHLTDALARLDDAPGDFWPVDERDEHIPGEGCPCKPVLEPHGIDDGRGPSWIHRCEDERACDAPGAKEQP